ncbi:MAG: hypothetical protein WCJ01_11445 [Ignavibacteria bacterium]
MVKINCWEYKKCGREIDGERENDLGICPVVRNYTHSGRNGGKGAGRICWEIAGTLCQDIIQGTFAMKEMNCKQCDFFELVKSEEGEKFVVLS